MLVKTKNKNKGGEVLRQRRLRMIIALVGIMIFLQLSIPGQADTWDAWAKAAQVGQYAPETEDWNEVYEKAKKEGKVVIYSSTSRIFDAATSFEELYPGIEVEAYNISGVDIVEKISREWAAGLRMADLALTSAFGRELKEMLAEDA